MNKTVFVLITLSLLVACSPMETRHTVQQEISDTAGGLEIDGTTYDSYTLWGCRDYVHDEYIALELVKTDKTIGDMLVGALQEFAKEKQEEVDVKKTIQENKEASESFQDLQKIHIGFILFDGTKDYAKTFYMRDGINHRWEWEDGNYVFIMKPDGTGLYYDFTNVKKGESTKAKDVFKCKKYHE